MESRVKELLDLYLKEGSGSVRFVGICGMGGMGKTTLAQEICNRIYCNFDATRFIANVRETKKQDLVSLQKQLLSMVLMESEINIWNVIEGINVIGNRLRNTKVLIVLDDVDDIEQLEALAGKHEWFGLGSRIIITSRDNHLLGCHRVDCVYTTKRLSDDEALELFSWKAFKEPHPDENYMDLSMDFVNYAQGLPLALKVLGSSLFGKRFEVWRSARDNLKRGPNRNILSVLKISYDGLMDIERELFLDIACFFKGEKIDCIRDILESFGYSTDYNIDVLVDKSLITIDEEGILWMHGLLQKMGQEIVCSQSFEEPGGRSRLWMYEDVLHVLKKSTGTERVEVIMLNTYNQREECLDADVFSKMKKMRLLKICNVQLPQGLNYLSDELRVIEWHGYPLKSMPTCFQPNKLVELRMHCSGIEQLWKEIIILKMLKLIDLSDSQNLIEIPNLIEATNLKQLILQGCMRLPKIHESLGNLKQLIRLDLNGCKSLESLPHTINLESLEVFILSGCSSLKKFPEVVGNMSCLLELYLNGTAINDLPLSMKHLTGLIKLDLRDCKSLSSLPNACCSLMSLKVLTLSGCSKLDELPENLGNLKGLEELDVSGTAIKGLPKSINLLKNLRIMSFHGCEGPSPKSSNKLLGFPLMSRSADPMGMLVHNLSGLCSLIELDLSYCNLQTIPDVIGCLSSLLKLDLKGNNFVYLPKSMVRLSNLKVLYLICCMSLRSLPKLPLNIKHIHARGCTSLETLSVGLDDDFWPTLYLLNCIKLMESQGYNDLLSTMLRRYILNNQRYFDQDRLSYGFEIPGSEIPKWFSHQNVEASVNLHVPSHLCNKFMGIAVCVVFEFCQLYPLDQLCSFDDYGYCRATQRLWCSVKANGFAPNGLYLPLSEEFGNIKSYQLWLEYYPSTSLGDEWRKELNRVDANGFSQIEVTFETEGPGLRVTKCGAHLVFEQDVEDLKQTMAGSCSITSYEDDLDDLGEGTSNEIDIPQPRRKGLPNLIQRFIPHFGWFGN
ncbi:disease resistance protein RPV1-like [Quercus robur]|uniref:disease resistance protein RPV1-like n=1 Tax=Quercus robur TaxID=38942 RepID=UPI002161A9CB|nr:disease resistance protein RPV1-like [Quercus robur]